MPTDKPLWVKPETRERLNGVFNMLIALQSIHPKYGAAFAERIGKNVSMDFKLNFLLDHLETAIKGMKQ